MTDLGTHENLDRDTNNNGTAETAVRLRPGSLGIPQPPSMTGPNQQYQRPRRGSLDSLYSGAIEGCSRDHHPECYPELWQEADKSITSGHDQDRITTDLAGQPQPPSPPNPPLRTPSSSTSSSSNETNKSGGYKYWLIRKISRKLLPKAGTEKAAAANKPSRKGKESPLTMEDRMFFMGIRPRPEDAYEEKEPSCPPPPPPPPPPPLQPAAGAAASSASGPVIGGFMTYPQIGGFHHPARASGSPLVVTNPDPGSEAERVRDDAARGRDWSGTGHRSSNARSKSKAKAKGSRGGRLEPKDRLRPHEGVSSRIHTAKRF